MRELKWFSVGWIAMVCLTGCDQIPKTEFVPDLGGKIRVSEPGGVGLLFRSKDTQSGEYILVIKHLKDFKFPKNTTPRDEAIFLAIPDKQELYLLNPSAYKLDEDTVVFFRKEDEIWPWYPAITDWDTDIKWKDAEFEFNLRPGERITCRLGAQE